MKTNAQFDSRSIAIMGMLVAVEIVLSRFCSISAWNIKIGFAFAPVAAAAVLLGPLPAALVAALGDFMGAILFPVGPYFPGFTLTAFCTGLSFGLLHKKQTLPRLVGAVAVNQLVLSLLVNSLWISLLYSSPLLPLLGTRAIQCAVVGPVQLLLTGALCRAVAPLARKRVRA